MVLPFLYFFCHLLSTALLFILLSSGTTAAVTATTTPALAPCDNHRLIVAYMIYTKHRRRPYEYGKNFTSSIFAGDNETIEIRLLPPVQSEGCGEEPFRRVKEVFDKTRGGLLSHINVWDHFYRRRRKHCEEKSAALASVVARDVMIVFEHDAFAGHPDAGALALASLRNMTSHLHYLGYCHPPATHPKTTLEPPRCLHAYALTVAGARLLRQEVNPCDKHAVDQQVAKAAKTGKVTWTIEQTAMDAEFVRTTFAEQGIRQGRNGSHALHFDGLFVQGHFELTADERLADAQEKAKLAALKEKNKEKDKEKERERMQVEVDPRNTYFPHLMRLKEYQEKKFSNSSSKQQQLQKPQQPQHAHSGRSKHA